jgi:hypothetical protein
VKIIEKRDNFLVTPHSGFIYADHLSVCHDSASDFVTVAEKLLNAPYLSAASPGLALIVRDSFSCPC